MHAAANLTPDDFVKTNLLAGEAYVFNWTSERYGTFRREMAAKLQIHEDQVRLIGSAKLGFSLNRDHLLQRFRRESDLDLVVVDSDLFDGSVLELRQRARELGMASQDERRRLRRSRDNIFNGYLRPDQLPLSTSLMRAWFPRLAGPFHSEPARSHPVKAWLFKSWDHAHLCYKEHHLQIQPALRQLLAISEDD
jgi:hypothetical protein